MKQAYLINYPLNGLLNYQLVNIFKERENDYIVSGATNAYYNNDKDFDMIVAVSKHRILFELPKLNLNP